MRFLSYNIKSCLQDGLQAVAAAAGRVEADVVGLQEVDRGTLRADGSAQADELAARLGLEHAAFAAAVDWPGGGEYGIALLARHPLHDVRVHRLYVPTDAAVHESLREPRVLLSATVRPDEERAVRVFVTHLGLHADQRSIQAREIAAALQQAEVQGPVVLMGDLNAEPDAPELIPLHERLDDAHAGVAAQDRHTFPAGATAWDGIAIDYVLASRDVGVRAAFVARDDAEASDHHPCVADLILGGR